MSEQEEPRFLYRQSDEPEFDVQWEVSRQAEDDAPFVLLKLTNNRGDVVRIGFRPPGGAADLGSALIEGSGQGRTG